MKLSCASYCLAFLLLLSGDGLAANTNENHCRSSLVQANGKSLWVDYQKRTGPTLIFEAGGGNDSTVWASIIRNAEYFGASTFIYDRAGLGKSEPDPSPYSIQREVRALNAALSSCHITGKLVIVAHSYGGNVALLTAAQNPMVVGVVLLDTVVPGYNNALRVQNVLDTYRPQYEVVREKAPTFAATVIPMMEAYPETAKALDAVRIPRNLPIIDIVAEKPAEDTPVDKPAWYASHQNFVRADPERKYIFAAGSGHKIYIDRPDLVLQAIGYVLLKANSANP